MANMSLDIDHLLTAIGFKPTTVQVLGDIAKLRSEFGLEIQMPSDILSPLRNGSHFDTKSINVSETKINTKSIDKTDKGSSCPAWLVPRDFGRCGNCVSTDDKASGSRGRNVGWAK